MKNLYHFQIGIKEVKAIENGGVKIAGYASTPDIDRYNDIVEPEAFADALTLYMKNPALLRSHNSDNPCGSITSARITNGGLWVEAIVNEQKTVDDITSGRMRAFSIGYRALETELRHKDGSPFNYESDNPWGDDIVRVIKKLDLVEISIVATPANGHALFTLDQSVKQYFSQLATKSMLIKQKEVNDEVIENEANIDEVEHVENEKTGDQENEQEPESEEKELETESEDKAAEGDEQNTETANNDDKAAENTVDEAEKGVETTPADSGEAGDEPSEEPKADADQGEISTEPELDSEKSVKVDEITAKSLPEFVQVGLLVESKETGAINFPPAAINLIKKLADEATNAYSKVSELQSKLNETPAQRALSITAKQLEPEAKADEQDGKEKQVSKAFRSMFGL